MDNATASSDATVHSVIASMEEDTYQKRFHQGYTNINTNTDMVNFYNEWADTYDDEARNSAYQGYIDIISETAAEAIGEHKDFRILDCCAGTGLLAEKMVSKYGFHNLDALDASEAMLQQARGKNIYKNLYHELLGSNKLNIVDNTYDAVVVSGGFWDGHLDQTCLPELIRIVKPDGVIVTGMTEMWVESNKGSLEAAMKEHENNGHWKQLQRKSVPAEKWYNKCKGVIYVFQVKT